MNISNALKGISVILALIGIAIIIALLSLASYFASTNWLLALILVFIAIGIFGALVKEAKEEK